MCHKKPRWFQKIPKKFIFHKLIYAILSLSLIKPANAAPKACVQAVAAAGAGRWAEAYKLAKTPGCGETASVVAWVDYQKQRAGQNFSVIAKFLINHPHWPHQKQIRRLAEDTLASGVPDATLLAFFKKFPPLTGRGALYYAGALANTRSSELESFVQHAWHEVLFNEDDEKAFLNAFAKYLKPHDHIKRLDGLLWKGHVVSAKRLFPKVPALWREAARVRLALDADKGTPQAILRLPPAGRQQAGMVYSVARWYVRHDKELKAAPLILGHRGQWEHPALWWRVKAPVVRTLINQRQYQQAYLIANQHGITPQSAEERADFAEAEWIAGWVALKHLRQPQRAAHHFERLYRKVEMPVSKARAAYWMACAETGMRKNVVADAWFEKAAAYPTTFYGQLAQQQLKKHHFAWQPAAIARPGKFGGDPRLIQGAILLSEAKLGKYTRSFLKRLIMDAASAQEQCFIVSLAHQLSGPLEGHVVAVAQKGGKAGEVRVPHAYPVVKLPKVGIESALVLAVIRRETGFAAQMVGGVGELGLMQVRPETAKELTRRCGQRFDVRRMKGDSCYNIQIGARYLEQMVKLFDGSYVLAVAAYNAGLGNVRKWLKQYGDPRAGQISFVDWIENIPFADTRSYVQSVLASVAVYRHRLGEQRKPLDNTGKVV